jgi:putative ABC transport system permease protein
MVAAVAAILRRLRAERGMAVLVFVVVAVTSFVVAAGPRLFNHVADDALRYGVERATAVGRNFQFSTVDRLPADDVDPFARVVSRGEAIRERLPDSVDGLIGESQYVVDSTRFQLADPPNFTTYVTLRQASGLEDQLDLVDGRWPARVTPTEEPARAEPVPPVFEIAMSAPAADAIGVRVGDRLPAAVDPGDPLLRNTFPRPVTAVAFEVVGTFAVRDPVARYWFDDQTLANVAIGGTDDNPLAFATAVFAPEAYDDLIQLDLPNRYRWNLFTDVDRLDAGTLDVLLQDLRRLDATFVTTGAVRPGRVLVRSGLLGLVERYLEQRTTTEAALSVAAIGPLAVAAGAVGLIGILVVRRRRPALALARGRGASGGQLLAAQLWEGLLITVPAALIGLALAGLLVNARPSALSAIGAILVALGATALLVAATVPAARRARRDLERDDPPVFRVRPRRLVFEAMAVVIALAAAWLLRERGLTGQTAAGGTRGFDPFLAATPVLVGLAVGLVIIRLFPLPVRGLGWVSARRRDLVPVLGLRSLGRHPSAGYLPLLILTLTMAIGTLSSILQVSVERSQVEVAWADVGADYRIETASGAALDPALDPRAVTGAGAVAAGFVVRDAALSTAPSNRASVTFEAIDAEAYDEVVAGSPVALGISGLFVGSPTTTTAGSKDDPIPAIVSTALPAGSPRLADGDVFDLTIKGRPVTFRVVGRLDDFPGMARSGAFVVAPLASVVAGWTGNPITPTVYYVAGPPEFAAGLRSAAAASSGTVVIGRDEQTAAMRDAPLTAAVTSGFTVALLVAAAYAGLAIVAVVILHAQRRSREVGFLRTLGVTDRQVGLLSVVEHGLPLLLALVIGVALGIGLAWLIEPGLDLAAFSSPDTTVILQVDWTSITVVAASVAAVVAIAVLVSSWLVRRLEPARALRIGEEGPDG